MAGQVKILKVDFPYKAVVKGIRIQAVNGEHIRELRVQTRKHDYVDGTLIPVGGVPDSGNDGIEDGKFLVTDMAINSPLDPSTFPVLTRDGNTSCEMI